MIRPMSCYRNQMNSQTNQRETRLTSTVVNGFHLLVATAIHVLAMTMAVLYGLAHVTDSMSFLVATGRICDPDTMRQ